jgi:hypothetical protein
MNNIILKPLYPYEFFDFYYLILSSKFDKYWDISESLFSFS